MFITIITIIIIIIIWLYADIKTSSIIYKTETDAWQFYNLHWHNQMHRDRFQIPISYKQNYNSLSKQSLYINYLLLFYIILIIPLIT